MVFPMLLESLPEKRLARLVVLQSAGPASTGVMPEAAVELTEPN
jgi:hypothetical protein